MINIDLPIVATGLGIIVTMWKFASSISQFSTAVDDLKISMKESKNDRRELRNIINRHETDIKLMTAQYGDIKTDLIEIKNRLKEV